VHARSAAATIEAKPYARSAAARAIGEHLERTGRAGDVLPVFGGSYWRVRWRLPAEPPSVTIVVCTRDGVHLSRCLESIWSRTSYPNYQLLVVDNGSIEERTAALLATARAHGAAVKEDTRPFNFSALNNAAVRDAASEFICFLNDDVEVITGDWLEEMVGQALQPGVGAVGAKLYFPDGTIQHAGVILGAGGVAGHSHLCTDRLSLGYFARAALVQQMSAVTAAAMVVRREVFRSLGGFDEENLGVAFNDVDFCLRLGVADMKVVWTPFAELYHRESATRGLSDVAGDRFQREVFYMQGRWGARLREDPFYNVNLGLDIPSFSLAWPPRTPSSADDGRAR
jgi:GT2 family glycosyltransferase